MLDLDGGAEAVLPSLHRNLTALQQQRSAALSLGPTPGDVEATYRELLDLLDTARTAKIRSPAEGRRKP